MHKARQRKLQRAKLRHKLFTTGPNKLSRGKLFKKHFDQSIQVNEVPIHSSKWPASFNGLRIAHVSDFHLGDLMPLERAKRIIDLAASQEPDLIACTGDVVDLHAEGVESFMEALASVSTTYGTYLVLGNHDELDKPKVVIDAALQVGIHVLQDSTCTIHKGDACLQIAGVGWAKSEKQCSVKVQNTCSNETHLLLSHNPKAFHAASELSIPLTLSGHTHGGQIALKRKKRVNLAAAHKYTEGLYQEGDANLFVTVGVGAWFPLRVNCPAEIAMLTVTNASQ
tara:strand:+ start:335 stop:1180 length:846 start_codon:yes stop_codon:yes gene_type:complete